MKLLNRIVSMFHISNMKFEKQDKPSVVKDVIKDPDSYKLEMYVEDGEIIVKIKKRVKDNEAEA